MRWNSPTLGQISPAKFVPLAEETGLIMPIGTWVLQEACRQNKTWQDAGLPHLSVSVNVSALQFRDNALIANVEQALEAAGLAAKYLELELAESTLMQNADAAVATMRELRALGVQFSIDDFGTGYSNLSALKNFPVARLKIDKSFVDDVTTNAKDRAVASAVISLGQKLAMRVLAEGVETEQQLDILREQGCDEVQGYLLSRPVSPERIAELIGGAGFDRPPRS